MTDYEGILGEFIGLVAVVLLFSTPIFYIVARSRRQQRAIELLHAERMAAIERGMELPATSLEILGDQIALARKPRTALLPGLVWFFVGLAITATSLSFSGRDDVPIMVGLIPAGIGLAYLIYYFVEERKQVMAPDSTTKA